MAHAVDLYNLMACLKKNLGVTDEDTDKEHADT